MGRTYLFECPQCHYRARISGGADGGRHCEVQTVVCRDCRELFDVVTREHRREGEDGRPVKFPGFQWPDIPTIVLGESSVSPAKAPRPRLIWRNRELSCRVDEKHFVEAWSDPGRCPHCGNFMEKTGRPFRVWD